MAEVFSAQQPGAGNGERQTVRVSLIQGVINKLQEANAAKQEAADLLDNLRGWLIRSLERDVGFTDRMVQAIADNTTQIDSTLLEDGIKKIAAKFGANGNNAEGGQS